YVDAELEKDLHRLAPVLGLEEGHEEVLGADEVVLPAPRYRDGLAQDLLGAIGQRRQAAKVRLLLSFTRPRIGPTRPGHHVPDVLHESLGESILRALGEEGRFRVAEPGLL